MLAPLRVTLSELDSRSFDERVVHGRSPLVIDLSSELKQPLRGEAPLWDDPTAFLSDLGHHGPAIFRDGQTMKSLVQIISDYKTNRSFYVFGYRVGPNATARYRSYAASLIGRVPTLTRFQDDGQFFIASGTFARPCPCASTLL